jgi:hypothetical protein
MMSKLPQSDFTWMSNEEIEKFDIENVNLDGEEGYIIECNLKYPKKLHKSHSNLPLAPEIIQVNFENLSPYAKKALLATDSKRKYKDVKLISSFHDRENYVVHGKNLKLYKELGLEITKIFRILKFKQSNFIAPFIEKCTESRQNASTKFEMDQFKKLVRITFQKHYYSLIFRIIKLKINNFSLLFQANSVFGKTMQNVRDYLTVKLHTSEKSALKAISKYTFKNYTIIGENLVQTNHFTPTITHDKPIAIGFTILELVNLFFLN